MSSDDDTLADRLRDEVGRLTRHPPAEFTAARTARAKALKADGEAALAKALAATKRPTVPAWAADQLAHHHGDELDALLEAAGVVHDAQSAASPDRDAVRDATRTFTGQVRALRSLAAELLRANGTPPDAHLDEVEATLLAAASDPVVAAELRAGALVRPAPSPGFAAFAAFTPTDRPARRPRAAARDVADEAGRDGADDGGEGDDGAAAAEAQRAELEARRAELETRRSELTAQRDELTDRANRAGEDADRARREAADLRAQADDAAAVATRADREREELTVEADRVAAQLAEVVEELDDR